MERIDKIISNQTNFSRSEIKKMISAGKVLANGKKVLKPEEKFDTENVSIKIGNDDILVQKNVYLLLNKPKGYVSSTEQRGAKTVLDLVPDKYKNRNLFPAGRLDKDTTGLMLITDDGEFAHNILSPRKHVKKVYEVTIDIEVTSQMADDFENGVMLSDGECKRALFEIKGKNKAIVTLVEGRYHQIKRMFGCYGAKVVELNRICMGDLFLPDDIKLANIREATESELRQIQEK